MTTIKTIELLAHSEIAGRLVPTLHGTFETQEAAKERGKQVFKTLAWAVGEHVVKIRRGAEREEDYLPVTKVFNGR